LSDVQDEIEEPRGAHRPLLILYEEAELFLHPGLQKILLRTFAQLKQSRAQVVFTTHSPFMLQNPCLSTINLVSKSPEMGTQVVELHAKMEPVAPKKRNRLLQVQNVSSYIFADKALLVEGESDRIVLKKLAPALRSGWDFEQTGIPILSVVGKGNLPLFKEFLEALGIEAFVLTDVDSIKSVTPRLCTRDSVQVARQRLLQKCDQLVDAGKFKAKVNKKCIGKLVSRYEWDEVFNVLEQLCGTLEAGEEPTEKQTDCLRRLVSYRETDARTQALKSDHPEVVKLRTKLVELLLDDNILLLSGTTEDYYPGGGGNKIEAALKFDPQCFCPDELCSCFAPIADGETTDMEAFLGRAFNSQ
jgi:putative ATP-dependent endonuclease of OLD family